jgi:uncharacterized protein
MKIWLDQVREEPFSWDETVDIAVETLERPEMLALGPVRWQGEAVFADPGFLLRGRLSYEQTLACIRCLKPHGVSGSAEVELLVMVAAHHGPRAAKGDEQELEEDDLNTLVVAEEVVDTRPLVVEQLQLNIPMKPLCRPDCRGLCPRCGADRNELPGGECACVAAEPDPRWAALAALKGRLDAE